MPRLLLMFLLVCGLLLAACSSDDDESATEASAPGVGASLAHAHNDYEHERPLLDALERGFASAEADVFVSDDGQELYVAHDAVDIDPARTLEVLYLQPLADWVDRHGGWVHEEGEVFQLLVDLKSDGATTWPVLEAQLARRPELFVRRQGDRVLAGPVLIVVSGNRPRALMEAADPRYSAYDGRMGDLADAADWSFMPLISDNWTNQFGWLGIGPMPPQQKQKLLDTVAAAHADQRRLRFWATPDADSAARQNVWCELHAAGVDYINTDDLEGLQSFLAQPPC